MPMGTTGSFGASSRGRVGQGRLDLDSLRVGQVWYMILGGCAGQSRKEKREGDKGGMDKGTQLGRAPLKRLGTGLQGHLQGCAVGRCPKFPGEPARLRAGGFSVCPARKEVSLLGADKDMDNPGQAGQPVPQLV